jgi:hypothetical protein
LPFSPDTTPEVLRIAEKERHTWYVPRQDFNWVGFKDICPAQSRVSSLIGQAIREQYAAFSELCDGIDGDDDCLKDTDDGSDTEMESEPEVETPKAAQQEAVSVLSLHSFEVIDTQMIAQDRLFWAHHVPT